MNDIWEQLKQASSVVIVQAENPDGDSMGSAMALEEILGDMGKKTSLYCPVDMPKYLRYINGWDRIDKVFDYKADMAIIVDTTSKTLMQKALTAENEAFFNSHPTLVLDHHLTQSDLPFKHHLHSDSSAVATAELLYKLAIKNKWPINPQAAEHLTIAILSDSLGFSTQSTTASSIETVAALVRAGASISTIEDRRRQFMKKSPDILKYKGILLQRISYSLDGALATVHIPWEEIEKYSDQYNPSMLALDEMRLVEGVRLAVALKTYPDGKITGKLRANRDDPVAEQVAAFFGGGGHPMAAGFRVYDSLATVEKELVSATTKALGELNDAAV